MNNREQVSFWLKRYGQKSGKIFELRDGIFAAKDEKGQEYVVDVPEISDTIYLCSPIVYLNNPETKASDLKRCMQWNLYGKETYGGTLGLDKDSDRIIFHKTLDIQTLDENSFASHFNDFIRSVQHIQMLWEDYQRTQVNDGTSEDLKFDPHFRV